ncbi:uncharacterized protein I303_106375 [Kwoniella dejecticola CBS 10117]|uniref:Uncharacterized protein n=1 Tax=Kwoniella dejecticola CBS 10117 TaxID=1296121 RepID=A0A1A5ZUW3_9TREE|nr:uncharacterized protein I303_08368 [Kwoniella dejecticola CBS 10117]OBR81597.1 hypothetical protein I303_08368 [Kwoniella dejecticola CBS 10117]
MVLDKDHFVDSARLLYRFVTLDNWKKVDQACMSIARSRFYRNAIHHLIDEEYSQEYELGVSTFNLFPNLESIRAGGDCLEVIRVPDLWQPSEKTQAILWEEYDDPYEHVGGEYLRDLKEDEKLAAIEKQWDLKRKIGYVVLYPGDRDSQEDLDEFFKCWLEGRNLFAIETKEINLQILLSTEYLIKEMNKMRNRKSPMPKKLRLLIDESEELGDPRYGLSSVIEIMSVMVEHLEICHSSAHAHEQPVIKTTIHQFIAQPIAWPEEELKLKYLRVPLMVERLGEAGIDKHRSRDLSITPLVETDIKSNLLGLTIDLDFAFLQSEEKAPTFESVLHYLPDLHDIARSLLRIGGTGCKYQINVRGLKLDDEKVMSERLTSAIMEKMMEIWDAEPAGWINM